MSSVLRYGVILSFLVVLLGLVLLLRAAYAGGAHPGPAAIFPPPQGQAEVLRSLGEVVAGLRQGNADAVVVFGLLILLSTPIIQVAASAIAFTLQRDWAYVAITLFVLSILVLSFLIGAVG